MVTTRRKLGGLVFELFYGGSLVNGLDRGLADVARITGKQDLAWINGRGSVLECLRFRLS